VGARERRAESRVRRRRRRERPSIGGSERATAFRAVKAARRRRQARVASRYAYSLGRRCPRTRSDLSRAPVQGYDLFARIASCGRPGREAVGRERVRTRRPAGRGGRRLRWGVRANTPRPCLRTHDRYGPYRRGRVHPPGTSSCASPSATSCTRSRGVTRPARTWRAPRSSSSGAGGGGARLPHLDDVLGDPALRAEPSSPPSAAALHLDRLTTRASSGREKTAPSAAWR